MQSSVEGGGGGGGGGMTPQKNFANIVCVRLNLAIILTDNVAHIKHCELIKHNYTKVTSLFPITVIILAAI